MVLGSTSPLSRRALPALFAAWQLGCAGMEVPQARVHRDEDVTAALRAAATGELRCPLGQLEFEATGPRRFTVRGCEARATYCCFERALEVFCESAEGEPQSALLGPPYELRGGPGCHDPWLPPPPEVERFHPLSAVDYGILER